MSLYGPGEPALDFQHLREVARTSGRSGQTHPLGGMVGEAEYRRAAGRLHSLPARRFLHRRGASHGVGQRLYLYATPAAAGPRRRVTLHGMNDAELRDGFVVLGMASQ